MGTGRCLGHWTAGGVDGEGDLNAFSLLDPASVEWLSLSYNALTSVSGLESLTSLEYLELYYTTEPFSVTALPASLATLSAPYSGITSLPDLTTTPNLTWLNLHYSGYLEGEDGMKLAMLQQLDANGKSGGFVDIGNFDTGTPGAAAVITSLNGKGWSINV